MINIVLFKTAPFSHIIMMKVCADREACVIFSASLTNMNVESFHKPQITETWTCLTISYALTYKF